MTSTADLMAFARTLTGEGAPDEDALPGRVQCPALRSVLYVPGNRREWIRKCHVYGADAIVLDLEDSVPATEREQARAVIAEEIGALAGRVRSVWVRVNASEDSLWPDLEAAMRPGIAVVQLPKVFASASVRALDRAMTYLEGRAGLALGSTAISPILETAGGVLRAHEIAMCSPRVEYLGAIVAPEGDTARALRMRVMRDPVGTESLYVRGKVAVDARAAGVQHVVGGTVTDLSPGHSVLRAFCDMNRSLGYSGTLVIHPGQVPVAHQIFGPSAADIELALETLRLLRGAGKHAAVRNSATGQMVDLAHGRHAYWLLQEAAALGIPF